MTDAFDTNQYCASKQKGGSTCWTYTATPAQVLYNSTLPLPNAQAVNHATLPRTTHDGAWWAAKTKGMNFKEEDVNDPEAFNRIIWEGMMGNRPYPNARSGADLRHMTTSQPEAKEVKIQTPGARVIKPAVQKDDD